MVCDKAVCGKMVCDKVVCVKKLCDKVECERWRVTKSCVKDGV